MEICEALLGSVTHEERQDLEMSPDVIGSDIPLMSPTPEKLSHFIASYLKVIEKGKNNAWFYYIISPLILNMIDFHTPSCHTLALWHTPCFICFQMNQSCSLKFMDSDINLLSVMSLQRRGLGRERTSN